MSAQRILLGEDNPMHRRASECLIKARADIVGEARAGQEARAKAQTYLPDLSVMDLQLPGLDGFAAAKIIKQDDLTKKIPIVALTAYAMSGDAERALAAGCDGYITKPIDPDEFTNIVASYLKPPVQK